MTRQPRRPTLTGIDGVTTARHYDWSDRSHWGGGRRRPCRVCGRPSFLLDHLGLPAHKVCVDVTQATVPPD